MSPSSDPIKAQLREQLIAARSSIDAIQRLEFDTQISQHIIEAIGNEPPQHIAAYLAFKGEPDLGDALQRLAAQGHRLYLPVLNGANMQFRAWNPGSALTPNRFGILEPVDGASRKPQDLNTVLLPLVAYDRAGARLGMGGGYYDRCFAFCRSREKSNRPQLIGTAYSLQQINEASLPLEPWDVTLDAIVHEQDWHRFNPPSFALRPNE
ncbi:MAG: 5-formyltetrahydrofolate cyclo-ligase [Pseudomonadota bacterium]